MDNYQYNKIRKHILKRKFDGNINTRNEKIELFWEYGIRLTNIMENAKNNHYSKKIEYSEGNYKVTWEMINEALRHKSVTKDLKIN